MEIILLDRIENLGDLGDRVEVRPGYARNYLFPKGKAKFATAENIAEFEARRADLEKAATEARAAAEARRQQIEGLTLTLTAKTGSEGRLFGSIGPGDIVEAARASGIELQRREVIMPAGTLRQTGDYEIHVHLYTNINATIQVSVVAEE
jgi:large subunit ribosomal protein L9